MKAKGTPNSDLHLTECLPVNDRLRIWAVVVVAEDNPKCDRDRAYSVQ